MPKQLWQAIQPLLRGPGLLAITRTDYVGRGGGGAASKPALAPATTGDKPPQQP